ncbi:hypothetical protein [Vulcanisaeta souniana]|uniref:Uncharacterized protein n=1 Tax=Vulcanisaeta souniana JCM 11219 TaxID=1293586 RepID=A0A830DYP6_9CREN|nr:hypothetical protein [Vulcanisaeta souniana]BDR91886.1 hypothetical protein Vsou_09790 [Vulcanisaeta souniana JCM 11219]GGI69588.1 hypothetical protein GCM10007112_03230 [Vulcanisaeta souniana JCM 11219]
MQVIRDASNCNVVIREYRINNEQGSPSSIFVDLSMADYVELIIRDSSSNGLIHYPYRVIYTSDGDLLLIRAENYGDNRLRKHKASVCPFNRCRYLLGPLSGTRFVVRLAGFSNADPVIRIP